MELYRLRIDGRGADAEGVVERRRVEEVGRQLRLAGLRAERAKLYEVARAGGLPEDTARRLVREIDLLENALQRQGEH